MGVLTEKELKRLSKVKPTTKKDAKQILARGEPMLKFLRRLPTTREGMEKGAASNFGVLFAGNVGCPHCHSSFFGGFRCKKRKCAWGDKKPKGTVPCCLATFGGVTLNDTTSKHSPIWIEYLARGETIHISLYRKGSWREGLRRCIRFVLGHIEWAEKVLDGTMP